jgi:diguanylate cyclase (GGDEF)-like protein
MAAGAAMLRRVAAASAALKDVSGVIRVKVVRLAVSPKNSRSGTAARQFFPGRCVREVAEFRSIRAGMPVARHFTDILSGEAHLTPMTSSRARQIGNVITLPLPQETDRQRLIDWALSTVAQAEQRMAALQERIAYLEGLSITDELTGLLNRRGFLAELDRALAAARRSATPGVLMLCDLDGFKAINDSYGHNAGNAVLRQFAQLMAGKVRRADTLGRLGGDEFAVLLVGASLANGRRKAQALSQVVASTAFSAEGMQVRLGASFGLAAYVGEETADELMHHADLAMYGEKRRNAAARAGVA